VEADGEFLVEPLRILDHRETMLWKKVITQAKVQWKQFILEEATWEDESLLRQSYPTMFHWLQ